MLRSLVVQKREQMYLIVTFANTQISNNTYSVNIKMLMLGFFFVLFLQQSSVLFQSVFVFAPIRICICSSGPRAEEVTHLARRSRTKRFARCLAYLECTLCTGRYSVHCICIFHWVYFVLHTLSVHWAIQCAIIARCTALCCVLCIVYIICVFSCIPSAHTGQCSAVLCT